MTPRGNEVNLGSRNSVKGCLQRTIRNLEWMVSQQKESREEIHLGAQLTLSMLGMFLFPEADPDLCEHLQTFTLERLTNGPEAWPDWEVSLDRPGKGPQTTNLGTLVWRVRNAVSHRRVTFSSESLLLDEIRFQFQDAPKTGIPDKLASPYLRVGLALSFA